MSPSQRIAAACLLAGTALAGRAQSDSPTDQQLFVSGQIGYANGNCVKASRYWFAYLLRKPADMDAARRAKIEQVIALCDAAPTQLSYAYAMFDLKKPTKQAQCDQYADLAVAQFDAAQLSGCGFSGSRWSGNHAYHFNWCLTAKDMEPTAELNARKGLMAACAPER
ncbi:hypothetical protein PP715_23660 [Ralstonia solanacearum]|uniref:hypothetical protein n=1 Tax=Ralstonia solanacearum species complex TaxID=3116862 RepID=UPI0005ACF1E5|nr:MULTISPECIES: hypothetical protein [Ralstonia solanacearum species complex]AMP72593.1 hypothetical protein UW163_24020 [Ralstonia solanacearum]MCL9842596.1 hypothetical protein [Ralstonia solanacearum]MDB0534734.1 hypothetical protein [Ralstonia solanacearum]MDB0539471.1 hypothetical protein [Ralstonia solanacearum]MDB0549320.1 hypothetical protein [Ralstonia solanacearum]